MSGDDGEMDARELGALTATTPATDLADSTVDALGAFLDELGDALDADAGVDAARQYREFWDAYLDAKLETDERAPSEPAETPSGRVEQAFSAGILGLDLYQALGRMYRALDDGDPSKWTRRVHALSVEHYEHEIVGER